LYTQLGSGPISQATILGLLRL